MSPSKASKTNGLVRTVGSARHAERTTESQNNNTRKADDNLPLNKAYERLELGEAWRCASPDNTDSNYHDDLGIFDMNGWMDPRDADKGHSLTSSERSTPEYNYLSDSDNDTDLEDVGKLKLLRF